ncbi:PREDICTED: phytosulfokines [Nelumbo nucifera]|uniref:Phytosulfokine n=2 Tax=Nelumbo nucifera TaxID=4432 RepID=A0A822ZD01_NELNU|nr:PREDICTED: phytosulfokines [Nelumbo nucifera]DAD41561.1 TPA_asm: hypothetical protein HUJ06_015884 [Nelumbo nucifera]
MSKATALFVVALLLFVSLTQAARPEPTLPNDSVVNTQPGDDADVHVDVTCDGIGEDECLMRRTLTAHTDYIYTQDNGRP